MRRTLEGIQAWRRVNQGQYPGSLSMLKNAGLLPADGGICPDVLREAEKADAKHHLTSSRGEGKDPDGWYEYELSSATDKYDAERRWLPPGTPPFTRQQLKTELLRRSHHEQVPILRCSSHRHVAPDEFKHDSVTMRNITVQGRIYWSGELWEQNWLKDVPYPCRETIVLFGLKGPPFYVDKAPTFEAALDLRPWACAFGDHPWWWTVPLFDDPPNSMLAPHLGPFFEGNHARELVVDGKQWWVNGLVQVQGKMSRDFADVYRQSFKQAFPWKRTALAVGRNFKRAEWLQATIWNAPADTEAGWLVWHYRDGASERVRIIYGRNTARFWADAAQLSAETEFPRAAWTLRQSAEQVMRERWLRLYRQAWENPRPQAEVVSLDFFTNEGSPAAPFIVSINLHR